MFNKIEQLSIAITDYCNLQCSYCHQYKSNSSFFSPGKYDDLNSFIESLPLADKINVHIIGGEASLFPEKIKDLVKSIKRIEKRKDVNFTFTTTSNASNMEELIKLFKKGYINPIHTAISWDGIHSCSMSRKPTDEHFTDEFFNNKIVELGKSDFGKFTHITYAVTNDTVDDMYESLLFLLNNNIPNFSFYFVAQYDYSDKDLLQRFEKQINFIADEFIKRYDDLEKRFSYHNWNVMYHRETTENISDDYHKCGRCGKILGIDIDGNVYPCTVFGDHKIYRLGTIEKGLNKKQVETFISDFMTEPNCDVKSCGIKHCSECPALTSISTGNVHDKLCNTCAIRGIELKVFRDKIKNIDITDYDKSRFWFVNENEVSKNELCDCNLELKEYDLSCETTYPLGRSCHC